MRECTAAVEDFVLYLYNELDADGREAIEHHVAACEACRGELESYRTTLDTVTAARLDEMATFEAPGDWRALLERLEMARPEEAQVVAMRTAPIPRVEPSRRFRVSWLAKAASLILLVGASFIIGRQWETVTAVFAPGGATDPQLSNSRPGLEGPLFDPDDGAARLRHFTEQTNGYLSRSRLVLLEIANADSIADSPALQAASRTLLRENERARQVAGQIRDERLVSLIADLEQILGDIARLSDADTTVSIREIRARVDDTGVLERLEILVAAPQHLAEGRARI